MPSKTMPFLRVEVVDAAREKLVISQQHYEDDVLTIETTSRTLTVTRRDLQLALLSITEEG